MFYLKNPVGRIVVVDTQGEYDNWLTKDGFAAATKEQIDEFTIGRIKLIDDMKKAAVVTHQVGDGIYFATVSPGGNDGYGVASGLLIREMQKLGLTIKTYFDRQRLAFLFHNPYSLPNLDTSYRIIYTMFESDKIPDEWIEYLKIADRVLVPSKWCASVFAKSGIDATVVPLGYDDAIFKPQDRVIKSENREPFCFLHYNAYNARKGHLEVFKAFTEEFELDEPVKLILKTTVPDPYKRFPINQNIYRNIEIITGKVMPLELQTLMARSDCFVFPSRGEGFGVPPIECMATGMPAIVPNAHGISEYFNADYMYEVAVAGETPALYSRYKGMDVGKMVLCDVKDLRRQMRYVYEHQQEAHDKGLAASDYAKQWTIGKTAGMLKDIIESVITQPARQQVVSNFLLLEPVR